LRERVRAGGDHASPGTALDPRAFASCPTRRVRRSPGRCREWPLRRRQRRVVLARPVHGELAQFIDANMSCVSCAREHRREVLNDEVENVRMRADFHRVPRGLHRSERSVSRPTIFQRCDIEMHKKIGTRRCLSIRFQRRILGGVDGARYEAPKPLPNTALPCASVSLKPIVDRVAMQASEYVTVVLDLSRYPTNIDS